MSIERLNGNMPYSAILRPETMGDVFAKVNELVEAYNTLEDHVRQVSGSAWCRQWDSQPASGVQVVDA
jgi:hypothetical protein